MNRGSVEWLAGAAAASLVATSLMGPAAHATGAIAVGQPADVARDGVSASIFVNARSADEARSEAMKRCTTTGSGTARALCKVMATFSNLCAAEALDPKDGTPGFGWAIADTSDEAKRQAIANCRETAGPDRQDACAVPDKAWCDGRAK